MLNVREAAREMPGVVTAVSAERSRYDESIRQARWIEGPVFIIGPGAAMNAVRAGARAFEWLLGWPALAREAAEFRNYSWAVLRPRSAVIAVSASGEDAEVVEVAQRASRLGVGVLALTANPESALAQAARAVFRLPSPAGGSALLTGPLAEHTALFEIAMAAAKIFNPRNPHIQAVESEFEKLPERIPWMQIHLLDPIRACAARLEGCRRLLMAGGSFYHTAAEEAVTLARRVTPRIIDAVEVEGAAEFLPGALNFADAVLLLSSSRFRGKKSAHALAARLKAGATKTLAITDGTDRDLVSLCEFSVLTPELPEIPGCLLSMILAQWLIVEIASGGATATRSG
ncbi:MAG: SIS domain-containing protein [Pseudomonadota bacterium]